jgi:hypothetical protein
MTAPSAPPPHLSPAEVRHCIENLLAAYTRAVDEHDHRTVTGLLQRADVAFDDGAPLRGAALGDAYRTAFAAGARTRHIVSVGHVDHDSGRTGGRASYPYQRWSLDSEPPVITALGWYQVRFSAHGREVQLEQLRIDRDWQRT